MISNLGEEVDDAGRGWGEEGSVVGRGEDESVVAAGRTGLTTELDSLPDRLAPTANNDGKVREAGRGEG